jgi:DNA-binding MarR family transcriptional regulator
MDENETTEIAKTIASDCIAIRVRFVSRVITKVYERALKPLDIKTSQMAMLVMLSVRGESSPADACKILQMDKSTVSRNVGRMRKKGWLEVTNMDDRPSQVIKVTPKGRNLLAALRVEWARAQEAARELLGEEGVSSVRKLYDAVRQT